VSSLLVLLPLFVVFVYLGDVSSYPRLHVGLQHRIKEGCHQKLPQRSVQDHQLEFSCSPMQAQFTNEHPFA